MDPRARVRLVDNVSGPRAQPAATGVGASVPPTRTATDAAKLAAPSGSKLACPVYSERNSKAPPTIFRSVSEEGAEDFLPRLFADRCASCVQDLRPPRARTGSSS